MTSPDVVDTVVIGAGVVGLAVARACAERGLETIVVEQHNRIGSETSSRNSGVVHSGIYYPTGSLKARLCVAGREQLYDYCVSRGIAHHRCSKLIVAQDRQLDALRALHARGLANGVSDLQWLDAAQVRRLEPAVRCAAAVLSPSTGIVDPHELMTSLLGDVEAHGGVLALNTCVRSVRPTESTLELTFDGDVQPLSARTVINAAGLGAVDVARRTEGYPPAAIPKAYLAKGNYFSCSGRPFSRLVYPMPNEAGLGVHATLDLNGDVRFGPDVEWIGHYEYSVDPARGESFYDSIREYWPSLPDGALQPAYAGIRPKVAGPGEKAADFMISGPAEHNIPGLVTLMGIESPGLTAALAIGDCVAQLVTG